MTHIPYARQDINQEDIDILTEALKSDYLTQGPFVEIFEKTISDYCGSKFSLSFNSATSALHSACLALGVSEGDYVWTSAITFVASANCAIYCGAKVDFIDIDSVSNNLSISNLREKLVNAEKKKCLPKVLVIVHFAGQPCDLEAIYKLSQEYHFKIIEDASHAIGAIYKSSHIGSCNFSDITVFSFHPVKIITTGEGGMITTNQEDLFKRLSLIRSHGINKNKNEIHSHPPEEIWNYEQTHLGFNFRMTDFQAALGVSQMKRLDEFLKKRHKIAEIYYEQLIDMPLFLPYKANDSYSAFHLYVIKLNFKKTKKTQKNIYEAMKNLGIQVNLHYIPVYRHPYYKDLGFKRGHCPEAENYFLQAMSLPMYNGLNEDMQMKVIESLRNSFL